MEILPARIERKIERIPFSGCWIWMGYADRYGRTSYKGKACSVHRAVYMLLIGEIPKGKELLHSCDIGVCVNPHHLSVGTHLDNMRDMVKKGRAKAPKGDDHWTRNNIEKARSIARKNILNSHGSGENNNNAKITFAIAEEIRKKHSDNPNLTLIELGKLFDLGREQTRKIIRRVVWKS